MPNYTEDKNFQDRITGFNAIWAVYLGYGTLSDKDSNKILDDLIKLTEEEIEQLRENGELDETQFAFLNELALYRQRNPIQ